MKKRLKKKLEKIKYKRMLDEHIKYCGHILSIQDKFAQLAALTGKHNKIANGGIVNENR
jgi:hypothetical protein